MSPASWSERASVLARSGLGQQRIVEHLGEPPQTGPLANHITGAWRLSSVLGFSPATLLERCAESARDIERLNREREGALAGPRLATRIILALPIGALGLTALLGLNPLAGLVNGLFGWLLLVLGGLLLWCGRRWMVRLVNTASRGDPAPGFAAEVLAALLDSGIALDRALAVTTAQWPGDMASVSGVLALAQGVGLPPATILRAEARALRDEAGTRARTRVSELTVKLTLPIGACVLPTFIVWGVVPVILSTFHSLTHS